jgi:hypothetical protein
MVHTVTASTAATIEAVVPPLAAVDEAVAAPVAEVVVAPVVSATAAQPAGTTTASAATSPAASVGQPAAPIVTSVLEGSVEAALSAVATVVGGRATSTTANLSMFAPAIAPLVHSMAVLHGGVADPGRAAPPTDRGTHPVPAGQPVEPVLPVEPAPTPPGPKPAAPTSPSASSSTSLAAVAAVCPSSVPPTTVVTLMAPASAPAVAAAALRDPSFSPD